MKKKILTAIITFTMIMGMNVQSVSADEFIGLSTNPPYLTENSVISTYDNYVPTETLDLSTSPYNVAGSANGQALLFTNYLFTGVDTISISISNKHYTQLTVKLYKKNGKYSWYKGSFTVNANSMSSKSFNVEKDSKYYFSFSSPSNFSGTIA